MVAALSSVAIDRPRVHPPGWLKRKGGRRATLAMAPEQRITENPTAGHNRPKDGVALAFAKIEARSVANCLCLVPDQCTDRSGLKSGKLRYQGQGEKSRKDKRMIKIAIIVWMMLGTAFAGSAMVAVLSIEGLASQPMKFIPIAVLCGFVVAVPLSYLVARKIGRPAAG